MSHPPVPALHPHPCGACAVHSSFCPLPGELREVLEHLKTSTVYAKGDVAFHESELCRSVFIICEGTVKLLATSSEGKNLLLRFAGPGEILGVAEAVRGEVPFECSAVAAEPSVLAAIPRETFTRFAGSYPAVACRMTRVLSEQYKIAQRETRFLAFGENSTARLARLLLDWAAERGLAAGNGIRIPSHVTHTELAESIGSTRETVTRIMSSLNQRGIVERTSQEIVILREQELSSLAAY